VAQDSTPTYPAFATIKDWSKISGLGRSVIYQMLGDGRLRAIKVGNRSLIDAQAGLAYLNSLPTAAIRAPRKAA
jgi:excisionase family DNA binding protein